MKTAGVYELLGQPSYIKRGSNGGPGVRNLNPPPPLRFVRGGVLCIGLMGRRGGPTVVFALLLSILVLLDFAC